MHLSKMKKINKNLKVTSVPLQAVRETAREQDPETERKIDTDDQWLDQSKSQDKNKKQKFKKRNLKYGAGKKKKIYKSKHFV